jgi:VanZ family protein
MGFIFWASTGTFSAQNTSLIIEPLLLFLAPSISPERIDMIHTAIRKSGHIIEYFILGLLLLRAFRMGSKELKMRRRTFFSIIVVILYAATDEFHQSLVSGRTASLFDICLDTLGGILAQTVIALRPHK